MVDVHNKQSRHKNMVAIRSNNTKPERFVRRTLASLGFRYRINVRGLPGTPDIVLKKHNAVIFVHGCFWHGHQCHLFKIPQTRTEFWKSKIQSNICRDERAIKQLKSLGWRILIAWECSLKGSKCLSKQEFSKSLKEWLQISSWHAEITSKGIGLLTQKNKIL